MQLKSSLFFKNMAYYILLLTKGYPHKGRFSPRETMSLKVIQVNLILTILHYQGLRIDQPFITILIHLNEVGGAFLIVDTIPIMIPFPNLNTKPILLLPPINQTGKG